MSGQLPLWIPILFGVTGLVSLILGLISDKQQYKGVYNFVTITTWIAALILIGFGMYLSQPSVHTLGAASSQMHSLDRGQIVYASLIQIQQDCGDGENVKDSCEQSKEEPQSVKIFVVVVFLLVLVIAFANMKYF